VCSRQGGEVVLKYSMQVCKEGRVSQGIVRKEGMVFVVPYV
jgi:hypothetical protein